MKLQRIDLTVRRGAGLNEPLFFFKEDEITALSLVGAFVVIRVFDGEKNLLLKQSSADGSLELDRDLGVAFFKLTDEQVDGLPEGKLFWHLDMSFDEDLLLPVADSTLTVTWGGGDV
ncbi:hypothetical protein [Kiloniella laminariae]|uniref:hypothetical protein n=1 Tax=Kiloniella laminariae TaxID=454162 RepID=UPI00037A68AD|nr:hypothetical protein [Kiloniella laminariae]